MSTILLQIGLATDGSLEAAGRAYMKLHMKEMIMLYYAAVFLVIALVAALFGFTGIAVGAASIARILFMVFLVFAAVAFIASLLRRA